MFRRIRGRKKHDDFDEGIEFYGKKRKVIGFVV